MARRAAFGCAGLLVLAAVLAAAPPSPAGAQAPAPVIAFARPTSYAFDVPSTGFQIFTINADGSGEQRITAGELPSWSPDGTRLAFLRDPDAPDEGAPPDLFVAGRDGSNEQRLAVGVAYGTPVWSPDGSRIAFIGSSNSVGIVDLAGKVLATVPDAGSPSWSPDGTRLAVTTSDGVAVVDAGGTGRTKIVDAQDDAWAPDGSRWAVLVPTNNGNDTAAAVVNADGSGLRTLSGSGHFYGEPQWSPDGRTILFELDGNFGGAIDAVYVVPADGSAPERVLADVAGRSDSAGNFSPDGSLVTIDSCSMNATNPGGEDPNCYVYVVGADGAGLRRLTIGQDAVFAPAVRPLPQTDGPQTAGASTPPKRAPAARSGTSAHLRSAFVAALTEPARTSKKAADLGLSAVVALMLLLVVFPAELFNSTFEEHYDEITGWFRRGPTRGPPQPSTARAWIGFALVVGVTSALYGLLDPHVAADRATAAFVLGVAGSIVVVTLLGGLVTGLYTRAKVGELGRLKPYPAALVVAGGCVALSRLAHFEPGYLYGIVAGFSVQAALSKADEGRSAAVSALATLAIAGAAWLAWAPVKDRAAEPGAGFGMLVADALLAAVFVGGLEGLVFSLLPVRFLNGKAILAWNRLVWAVLFAVGAFAFVHLLLAPGEGYDGSVITMVVLFGVFGAASVAFWAYFRYRPETADAEAGDVTASAEQEAAPFPIEGYEAMRAVDILHRLKTLTPAQLAQVRDTEQAGQARPAVLGRIARILDQG